MIVSIPIHFYNILFLYIQVAEFAVNIISSAICLWTSRGAAAVLGLTCDLFSNKTEEYNWSDNGHMTLRPEELLPSYINGLGREPWSQILPKVLYHNTLISCIEFPQGVGHSHQHILVLTLLHSERPKLYTILAFLSAIGLNSHSDYGAGTVPLAYTCANRYIILYFDPFVHLSSCHLPVVDIRFCEKGVFIFLPMRQSLF